MASCGPRGNSYSRSLQADLSRSRPAPAGCRGRKRAAGRLKAAVAVRASRPAGKVLEELLEVRSFLSRRQEARGGHTSSRPAVASPQEQGGRTFGLVVRRRSAPEGGFLQAMRWPIDPASAWCQTASGRRAIRTRQGMFRGQAHQVARACGGSSPYRPQPFAAPAQGRPQWPGRGGRGEGAACCADLPKARGRRPAPPRANRISSGELLRRDASAVRSGAGLDASADAQAGRPGSAQARARGADRADGDGAQSREAGVPGGRNAAMAGPNLEDDSGADSLVHGQRRSAGSA